jgi:hypothetical protein
MTWLIWSYSGLVTSNYVEHLMIVLNCHKYSINVCSSGLISLILSKFNLIINSSIECLKKTYVWFFFPSVSLSFCVSVSLFVRLPFCLCVRLSVCLSTYLFVCLPVWLPVCLPICLSVFLPACMSVCLSACVSDHCLSAFLFVCLSVCLSTCLCWGLGGSSDFKPSASGWSKPKRLNT